MPAPLPPPRIETPGPLLIAGLGRRFAIDDFAGIPAVWQELQPHLETMPRRKGRQAYGLVTGVAASGDSYFYLAGVEVSDLSDLDAGLTGLRLPAQRWAQCSSAGRAHHHHRRHDRRHLRPGALPAAGLVAGGMPDVLERYGDGFDPQTGDGGFEILVPVT